MLESASPTYLERGPSLPEKLNAKQRELLAIALENFPDLKRVQINTFVPRDLYEIGGHYDIATDDEGNTRISINLSEGEAESFRPLFTFRKATIEANAELLGIKTEEMTPEILQLFIIAHELGHIKDYLVNYESNPDLTGEEAAAEMKYHRISNLDSLPVPGIYPPYLARLLAESREVDVDTFLANFDGINLTKDDKIKTIGDLMDLQEKQYRASPPERYADEFARDLLLNHAERLGIELPKLATEVIH
jgi:hypothetical protein